MSSGAGRRRGKGGNCRLDDESRLDQFLRTDVRRIEHRRHVRRRRTAADERALADVTPDQAFRLKSFERIAQLRAADVQLRAQTRARAAAGCTEGKVPSRSRGADGSMPPRRFHWRRFEPIFTIGFLIAFLCAVFLRTNTCI